MLLYVSITTTFKIHKVDCVGTNNLNLAQFEQFEVEASITVKIREFAYV